MKAAQHDFIIACSSLPGVGNVLLAVPACLTADAASPAPKNLPTWTSSLDFPRNKSGIKPGQVCIEDSSRATHPALIGVIEIDRCHCEEAARLTRQYHEILFSHNGLIA
jgi:hypothetical protein